MLNKNSVISIALCLVLPTFVACGVVFAPINPPEIVFVICALLIPLTAAFFGHAARRQISKSRQDGASGYKMATVGLTIGYLEIALVGLVLFGTRPHHSTLGAYEASAVGSVRTLNIAAHSYASAHPQEGFPKTLKDLSQDNSQSDSYSLIDQTLASGVKLQYRFTYVPRSTRVNGINDGYQIYADPIGSQKADAHHFFTDQTTVIRWASGSTAKESSPAL
jgi:hypothetical protein